VFCLRHPLARPPSITQGLPPDHPIRSAHTSVGRQIRIPSPSSTPPPPSSSLYASASSSAWIRGGPRARARRHGRRGYTAARTPRPRPRSWRGCRRPAMAAPVPSPSPGGGAASSPGPTGGRGPDGGRDPCACLLLVRGLQLVLEPCAPAHLLLMAGLLCG
jgi:hypothetical protein